MGLTLTQVQNLVYSNTGTDASDYTNGVTDVNLCINKAFWKLFDDANFKEKETETDFVTVADTREYDIATQVSPTIFDALQNVAIQDPDTEKFSVLDAMGLDFYMRNYDANAQSSARPTHWIHRGGNIILYPTPEQVYTIRLIYFKVLDDITSSIVVPQSWHEGIEYGATSRAFYMLGDTNRGWFWEKKYNGFVTEKLTVQAKENYMANPRAALNIPEDVLSGE